MAPWGPSDFLCLAEVVGVVVIIVVAILKGINPGDWF